MSESDRPADPDALAEAAYAAFDDGDLLAARNGFEALLAAVPDDPGYHYMQGLVCKYLRDWDGSLRHNLRSLALRAATAGTEDGTDDEASRWNAAIAATALGDWAEARRQWAAAVAMPGGPRSLLSGAEPEQAGFAALALRHLGRPAGARRLLLALLDHARALAVAPATVDYFATSLPTLLLFDDDLAARQRLRARVLEAQALLGLGRTASGRARLRAVLRRDPGHARAADLLATSLPTP